MDNNASLIGWLSVWDNQKPGLVSIYHSLCERYGEPHKYYHNLEHVSVCLRAYSDLEDLAEHPFEVAVAIWFHDVIYDPRRRENEDRSVEYAFEKLGQFLMDEQLEVIRNLILVTKHDSEPKNVDEEIMIDVDLVIFGQKPEEFLEYEKNIRKEYSWLSERNYREGRKKLLVRFLDRDYIFYTELFRAKYEEQSRRNLRKSISLLS